MTDAVDIVQLQHEAGNRWMQVDSYQQALRNRYTRNHSYYAPVNNDQWPDDRARRPNKVHHTLNIIKPAVDVSSRLQSKLPRIALTPNSISDRDRQRAEASEKLHLTWLELSGWETWLNTLCRSRELYGKGILRTWWNKVDKRPDADVLENPGNLRIGYGTSDYRVMDWAMYEYALSPIEAMKKWPSITDIEPGKGVKPHRVVANTSNANDPLGQRSPDSLGQREYGSPVAMIRSPILRTYSEYENKQVAVWDYWYREGEMVCNATLVNGAVVDGPHNHPELPDLPFIVIENEHELGSPEGLDMVSNLIDLQHALNRHMSHWDQQLSDDTDTAWQVDADSIPPGMVPKGGQILAVGEGKRIQAIEQSSPAGQFNEMNSALWVFYHRITGLPEVLFGDIPGAQTSGRALAVQIEAAANRLDPKRTLLYEGLRTLLLMWTHMASKVNPRIEVGENPDGSVMKVGVKRVVEGFHRWKMVAPEVSPRDVSEHTTNVINQLAAKLISLESAQDAIGVDAPLDEIEKIKRERTDIDLFPGDVQTKVAGLAAMQQMQIAAQQLQPAPPNPAGLNDNAAQQDAYQAQPTLDEATNQGGQPMSQAGSPPAPGGPGVSQEALIRPTAGGGAVALNQQKVGYAG